MNTGEVEANLIRLNEEFRLARCGIRHLERDESICEEGRKGIQILAPMIGYRRKKDDAEQDRDTSAKPQPMLIGFRAVYVFDVAQTEGEDLPKFEHDIT